MLRKDRSKRAPNSTPGMSEKLEIGRSYSLQSRVEEWMTAEKAGNKGVDVLSTSMLVQLVEEAAIHCIEPALNAQDISLCTHIDLEHHRPIPVGFHRADRGRNCHG